MEAETWDVMAYVYCNRVQWLYYLCSDTDAFDNKWKVPGDQGPQEAHDVAGVCLPTVLREVRADPNCILCLHNSFAEPATLS